MQSQGRRWVPAGFVAGACDLRGRWVLDRPKEGRPPGPGRSTPPSRSASGRPRITRPGRVGGAGLAGGADVVHRPGVIVKGFQWEARSRRPPPPLRPGPARPRRAQSGAVPGPRAADAFPDAGAPDAPAAAPDGRKVLERLGREVDDDAPWTPVAPRQSAAARGGAGARARGRARVDTPRRAGRTTRGTTTTCTARRGCGGGRGPV